MRDLSDSGDEWDRIVKDLNSTLYEVFRYQAIPLFGDYSGGGDHSEHLGYVNLFPFMLGLLSPQTEKIEIIALSKHLLTEEFLLGPAGVLSLAPQDELFGSGENYWRGNVWAPVNLLVAAALRAYSEVITDSALANDMRLKAETIRQRWMSAMRAAWDKSGGPREYLTPSGEGGGIYPFAGWTAASMFLFEDREDVRWWDFWFTAVAPSTFPKPRSQKARAPDTCPINADDHIRTKD